MTRDEVARVRDAALSWLGTPYDHRQRLKGSGGGVDCAHLLAAVYHEAGLVPHIELPHYPGDWMLHRDRELFIELLEPWAQEIQVPMPGDVVVMRYGRCFSHGAVMVAEGEIVHAFINTEVALEDLSVYRSRRMKFFRVRRAVA